jgi:hypothetical protein
VELTKFSFNERGGTLLTREDGGAAVLCRPMGEGHIIAEWNTDNDPAFNIWTTFDYPHQLRRLFWDHYSGWYVRHDHLGLPRCAYDDSMVAEYDLSEHVDRYMTLMLTPGYDEGQLYIMGENMPEGFAEALEYAANWLSEVKGWQAPPAEVEAAPVELRDLLQSCYDLLEDPSNIDKNPEWREATVNLLAAHLSSPVMGELKE